MGARIVLGMDPGSYHFGVGCIRTEGRSVELVLADIFHAPRQERLYQRLRWIQAKLAELLDTVRPAEVAIEDAFTYKNARSALHLGLARGVAIGACLARGIEVYEYAPTLVKSAVAGSGRADKQQVKRMAELQLGRKLDVGLDASDALAVAICHAVTPLSRRGFA